ncbi:MAG: hypothetical protein ACYC4A_01525 [Desulfobulbia bacterium]
MKRGEDADKIVTIMFVVLSVGAAIFAHVNQQLRVEIARLEVERLNQTGLIGWVRLDQETKQLYFVRR